MSLSAPKLSDLETQRLSLRAASAALDGASMATLRDFTLARDFKGAHCGRGGRSGLLGGLADLLGARGADMCCSAAECQTGISLLATPFLRKGGALRGRMVPLGCAKTTSYRLH